MPSLIKFAGPGSLKDVDRTQGVITAYAAAFDNLDADGDVIRPGAFAKTIRERGPAGTAQIKMLFMHRFTEIIGKVLHLEEDDHGLLFRAKLLLGLQRAQDALELYSADMFEHSVGIDVILPERFRGGEILEVKLFDVSPVTFGANDQTPTISVKSLSTEGDALGSQVRKIRKALSLDLSDEMLADLEIGLVILEARVGALVKATLPPEVNHEGVLSGVLQHLKANPAPSGTKAVAADISGNDTLAADGPHKDADTASAKWLREVLTNLRQSHA